MYLILFALIIGIPILISRRIRSKGLDYHEVSIHEPIVFKVSKWAFIVLHASMAMDLCFIYFAFTLYEKMNVALLLVGAILLIITVLGYLQLRNTYVAIADGQLIYYKRGKVKVHIKLEDIVHAYTANGFIAIHTGERIQQVIPIYFKDVSRLLAAIGKV